MIAIVVVYAIISVAAFCRYGHERAIDRIALSLLAPVVLAWVAVKWVVSRVEELG